MSNKFLNDCKVTAKYYQHRLGEGFWCSHCDAVLVIPDESNGNFFKVFGHEYHTDDVTSVIFSLCHDCQK